ncbi:MAG: magnesium/cobalt transporter CorA [Desulfobacterales bacterium]|nr:MAG: magnesium/cobalt transporter CorA [Desulfobacterales bacterium]
MPHAIKKASKKAGLSPGTLVYIGEKRTAKIKIDILGYDESDFVESTLASVSDCMPFIDQESVTWINLSGIHDVAMIETLGQQFNLHPLLLEDVVNTGQRPKMDDYEDYLFIVLKMLYLGQKHHEIEHEQMSLVLLGSRVVISFQEKEGDVFEAVRARIRKGKGRIRTKGADYLAYALIDSIVDNYFKIFEEIGEQIEELQEEVISNPRPETLQAIQGLKREMIFLRKSVWPLREVVSALVRGESELVTEDVRIFLRDVYDHTIQVVDTIETFRDMLAGMLDIYLSSLSNKMNEVMKVLTIIATIFIPMTFVAGVYGMNFKFMPELEWHWSYPLFWAVLIAIFISMLVWFKRKKWL